MKKHTMLLKTLAICCAAFLATSAFAISQGPYNQQKTTCEKAQAGPYAFCYPKDVGLACPQDFYFFGDYLLFLAQEEGLDFAVKNTSNNVVLPLTGGNVEGFSTGSHDWGWNHGARVGLGFYLNHDAWNLEVKWTYLHIKENRSVGTNTQDLIVPFFIPPFTAVINNMRTASATWKTKFNTLDFTMGKPYFVSRSFIFDPFVGARAVWIDQDYVARYSGVYVNGHDGVQMDAKNDYWGIGLRGGFNTEWMLGAGWNIFGAFSGSMVYGKFDVSQQLGTGLNSNPNLSYEIDQDFYATSPNIELALGLCWTNHFCENKYRVALSGAYEFHYWWDQNQFKRFFGDNQAIASNDTVSRGDLSFNGLSFRMQFDF